MIQLTENQSKTWFKIMGPDNQPIDGSKETWSFPFRQAKGKAMNFSEHRGWCIHKDAWVTMPHIQGTWLITDPNDVYIPNSGMRIFIAELMATPTHELPGMIWVPKVRLVREATNLDLKRFGIFRTIKPIEE